MATEIRPAHCSGDSTGNSKEKIRRKCVSEPERISQTVQGGTHHKCVPLFSAGRGRFRKFLLQKNGKEQAAPQESRKETPEEKK